MLTWAEASTCKLQSMIANVMLHCSQAEAWRLKQSTVAHKSFKIKTIKQVWLCGFWFLLSLLTGSGFLFSWASKCQMLTGLKFELCHLSALVYSSHGLANAHGPLLGGHDLCSRATATTHCSRPIVASHFSWNHRTCKKKFTWCSRTVQRKMKRRDKIWFVLTGHYC